MYMIYCELTFAGHEIHEDSLFVSRVSSARHQGHVLFPVRRDRAVTGGPITRRPKPQETDTSVTEPQDLVVEEEMQSLPATTRRPKKERPSISESKTGDPLSITGCVHRIFRMLQRAPKYHSTTATSGEKWLMQILLQDSTSPWQSRSSAPT